MATKRAPKRAYSDDYLKFGFTSILTEGIEKPQCVICLKVLSAESMKPFQLRRHFEKEHPTYKDRDVSFFQRKSLIGLSSWNKSIMNVQDYFESRFVLRQLDF